VHWRDSPGETDIRRQRDRLASAVDDAATMPDSIKWHDIPAGRVAVIKVVKRQTSAGRIELLLYGPCGLVEVVIATT
jgi:hypothetical protein